MLSVPTSFGNVQLIAADPTVPGVWAWAVSVMSRSAKSSDSRIWHLDPKGGEKSWSLGSDWFVRSPQAAPALAACGHTAWFGINDNIFEIDSDKGVIDHFTIPATTVNPAAQAHRPSDLKNVSAIQAIACGSDAVAVARDNSSLAFVLDISTGHFAKVPLPSGHDAVAAAVARNGDVAFGLVSYSTAGRNEVLLYSPDTGRSATVIVNDSMSVRASDDGASAQFSTGIANQLVDVGDPVSSSTVKTLKSPPNFRVVNPGSKVAGLPGGGLVVAGSKGLTVTESTTAAPQTVSLGTHKCGQVIVPYGPDGPAAPGDTLYPAGAMCPNTAADVAVDGAGNIWYAPLNSRVVKSIPVPSANN